MHLQFFAAQDAWGDRVAVLVLVDVVLEELSSPFCATARASRPDRAKTLSFILND